MENASKALIMAGEILIAILIIGVLVYGFINIRNLSKTEVESKEVEQLAAFNKQYESYHRKLLRGVDVISLINKAIDNNKKYDNEKHYKITIHFELKEPLASYVRNKTGTYDNGLPKYEVIVTEKDSLKEGKHTISKDTDESYKTLMDRGITDVETFNDFKRRIFDCTDVKYNDIGRVSEMTFIENEREQNLMEGIIE